MLQKQTNNKWIELLVSFVIFVVLLVVYALAFSGNSVFDRLYLWQPNLQAALILVGLTAFPYYARYVINTIRR